MIAVEPPAEPHMSDLAAIGKALRQGRVAKGIAVEDAALELHLQVRQINALEKGDFGGFSSPAFIKGYLRACARLYGLDGDNLVSFYDSFLPQQGIHTPAIVMNAKKQLLAPTCINKNVFFIFILTASIAVILSLLWLALHYWSEGFLYKKNDLVQSVSEVGEGVSPPLETSAVMENISPSDVSESVVNLDVQLSEKKSVMTPSRDLQNPALHIEFIDDCWVQLKTHDGRVLHEKVHKKDEIFDISVKTPLHVWFGRAAAVNVSYNGAVVPVPVKQGFQSAQFILGDELPSAEIE